MTSKTRREHLTSVQIRPDIAKKMVILVRRGMSKSEIINEALKQYLIDQEFHEIRRQLIPYAQAKGIYTDEDVNRLLL